MMETGKVGNLHIELCMGVTMGHVSEQHGWRDLSCSALEPSYGEKMEFKRSRWDAELTFSFALYGARPGHLRANMK